MESSLPLTALDITALLIVLVSAVLAFMRGFVHEVLAIGGWVGAALVALFGLPMASPIARQYITVSWAADAAAAGVLFLGALIFFSILTSMISKRVKSSSLSALDRSLGVLFGIARGAVIIAFGFIVLTWLYPTEDDRPTWVTETRSLPLMESSANLLRSIAPADLLAEEDRARATVQETDRQARELQQMQETFERLTQPQAAPAESAGGSGSGAAAAPTPAYREEDLRMLQQLIESQQRDSQPQQQQ